MGMSLTHLPQALKDTNETKSQVGNKFKRLRILSESLIVIQKKLGG